MHTYTHIHSHAHLHAHTNTDTLAYTHKATHASTHVHTHLHIRTHLATLRLQSNSEHSRHWFFGGTMVIDGETMPDTLFNMVKTPWLVGVQCAQWWIERLVCMCNVCNVGGAGGAKSQENSVANRAAVA